MRVLISADETATHDGSDESDEEEQRLIPYNIFPETSINKSQKTLFEELEFEDEYARFCILIPSFL